MGLLTAAAGWLLEKIASGVVHRWVEGRLERYGIFNATCERCHTSRQVEIPEQRRYDLTCQQCLHVGTIYIENADTLLIHQVQYASINVQYAQITVANIGTAPLQTAARVSTVIATNRPAPDAWTPQPEPHRDQDNGPYKHYRYRQCDIVFASQEPRQHCTKDCRSLAMGIPLPPRPRPTYYKPWND